MRIYDKGEKTIDRYTVLYYPNGSNLLWDGVGCSDDPFHAQGVGLHIEALAGRHLGRRIEWHNLPERVKAFVRQDINVDE